MSNEKMFKKKHLEDEADEPQAVTSPLLTGDVEKVEEPDREPGVKKTKKTAPAPRADTTVDVGNDTTRLSCDLPRRLHTCLRVAAALSERSILGLIETLIVKHLLDKPSAEIIAEYHKSITE
jgi:hypothetical protein